MPIAVVDHDGERQEFAEANTWHVDPDQNLHLRSKSNGPVASFAAGRWSSVGHTEVQPDPSHVTVRRVK